MIAQHEIPANKRPVLGVGINPIRYRDVLRQFRCWVTERRLSQPSANASGHYMCIVSVHGIITAMTDPRCRDALNNADLATPDGMPVVWALRSFGESYSRRVYGPNLMLALCGQAARLGHRIFLYGGTEATLSRLKLALARRFPSLVIAGAYAPPFRPLAPEEDREVVRMIRDADADIVFVGISTPKQDYWMLDHRGKLPGTIMVGVGAAFNFHAGEVRQAPSWMQDAGLEWLFRLIVEPKRLWKRYLLITPLFLPLWALQRIGILRYERAAEIGGRDEK
jgi:N-acetylglucosaminyldiphosphoundecaprenol N-acetyl-beta-D-mannosaminyltransferase